MQNILQIILALTVLFSSGANALTEDDDFWLLLDYDPVQYKPIENIVWLYAGMDDFDGRYYGVAADLAVTDPVHFIFSATQQDYFVESTEINWGFNAALSEIFTLGLYKNFWGRRGSLEKNDVRVMLAHYQAGFNVQFFYETGDVELFLKPRKNVATRSVNIKHNASELSLGYRWPQIYWQLSHKKHNYQRDLSVLESRPRLSLSVNPIGLQQASALAEEESRVLLGYQYVQTFYEITFSRIKSAVSQQTNNYVAARVSTALNTNLQLAADVELPVSGVPFSAGLSLGVLW